MGRVAIGLIAAGSLALISWFVWRLTSRRWLMPCPFWLSWFVELENPVARENRAQTIVCRLGLTEGMCVLYIGSGSGGLTLPLAKAVGATGKVIAIDVQWGCSIG